MKKLIIPSSFENSYFLANVLAGQVFSANKQISIEDLPWNSHPKFKGVYLKHLILGGETNNQLSCSIVKIEPNCMLDTHLHDGAIEIHEVVAGSGKFYLDAKEIDYSIGKISIIPSNTLHKVLAGKDGLYLFAKFTPALQ
jgi:quercetin dioxygenase-like cupin family protein